MTRFARAKGSKSSNLKAPDDSTPWEVMKEQLLQAKKDSEESKNRQQAENQRIENYSNFLKEQKVHKRKATWCDFPETENFLKDPTAVDKAVQKKKKKVKKNDADNISDPSNEANKSEAFSNENTEKLKKKKKKKNKHNILASELEQKIDETNNTISNEEILKPKNKNKKKSDDLDPKIEQNIDETNNNTEQIEPSKKEKTKNKKSKQDPANISSCESKTEFAVKQTNKQIPNNQNAAQKKKANKKRGDRPTRRKEINDKSFQLIINGKEVELMRFDGFPIMKKDAERLSELKSNMIKKGIPKSEVNRTIKLERRRAEKALARLKRDVCYNCRKGGHNLSDCPELKSNIPGVDAAEGVCFKCGSTEHRQFECKVQRDKEFRFANCFICKEQGHIARQCPDNPKGLYPNGGSCKLCGDVTHLRKDCPTDQNKKEGTSIKLQTLGSTSNLEDIEVQLRPISEDAPKKPKKIKF